MNKLHRTLQRVEKEIQLKTSTLELDKESLKMREGAPPVMRWVKLENVLNPRATNA